MSIVKIELTEDSVKLSWFVDPRTLSASSLEYIAAQIAKMVKQNDRSMLH